MIKSKKSRLQKQLFKKYLLGFIIFQILLISISRLSIYVMEDFSAKRLFSAVDVYSKVNKKGIDYIKEGVTTKQNAYIEILDLDYRVKYADNSKHKIGYRYSEREMKDLFNGNIEYQKAFFLEKTLEILVVKEADINKVSVIFGTFLIVILIFLLGGYLIFFSVMARSASTTIEKPIRSLMTGINDFKNKIYSSRISFSAGNELDDLKDTFNDMAKTLEEEIKLREEAEHINKQLILDITHDLKTPLANIEGYCDLMISSSSLTEDSKLKYLDIIMSNSKRTNNLMSDLFELTRIDYSGYSLERSKVDFCELIRRTLSEYIIFFEDESKDYELNIPDTPIYAFVDKNSIDRAICNIINNFMKYSGNNTKLTLSLEETVEEIIFIISDDGKGIEESKCNSIFLPFSREDISRNSATGGTGLGLAITKKIIEKHGGKIELISSIDNGCKFVIILPKLM